jgi:hypothetical protein
VAAGGQVGGGGEVGAVARLRRGPCQADGQVGLADAGWADQQHVGGGVEVAAGGELVDEFLVDAGGGVVVEVMQGRWGGQRGEPEPAGQAAGLGGVDLDREQPLQRRGHRQLFGLGGGQHRGQVLGGVVQLQGRQVAAQLLVEAGLGRRAR